MSLKASGLRARIDAGPMEGGNARSSNPLIPRMTLVLAAILLSGLLSPGAARGKTVNEKSTVMGTELQITVWVEDGVEVRPAFDAARSEFERIEREMSEWRAASGVSRINGNAGVMPVKVTDELFKVIEASIRVSDLTAGAFDISWAALRAAWDFTPGKERLPAPEEVLGLLPLVDYREIALDAGRKTVFLKRPGMAIGLGAIAKGYAVDRAMTALKDAGIKDAVIKAGGDMRVQGTEGGRPWEIGIRHPRDEKRLLATLPLSGVSISTSGDYERYFIKDGTLYHHIMDPRTGYPSRLCQSVTILAPDTMTSDALSTAVFVLGPVKGMELINGLEGVEGIIVDGSGRVHISPGIEPGGSSVKGPDAEK